MARCSRSNSRKAMAFNLSFETNDQTNKLIRPSQSRSWNDLFFLVLPPPGFEPGTFESAVRRSTSVLSCHQGPNAQWWGYNPQTIVFSHETKRLFEWSDLEPGGFELTICQSWSEHAANSAIVTVMRTSPLHVKRQEMMKTDKLEFKAYVELITYIQIRTLGDSWESQDS